MVWFVENCWWIVLIVFAIVIGLAIALLVITQKEKKIKNDFKEKILFLEKVGDEAEISETNDIVAEKDDLIVNAVETTEEAPAVEEKEVKSTTKKTSTKTSTAKSGTKTSTSKTTKTGTKKSASKTSASKSSTAKKSTAKKPTTAKKASTKKVEEVESK